MRIRATVAEQLRMLADDPDRGDRLAAELDRLGRGVVLAVPSCVTVSIALARPGGDIGISIHIAAAPATVLASLAVPLSAAAPGDVLVLRASAAGAFLLLADDLDGLLGAGHPPLEVDRHLIGTSLSTTESFAASLADLSVVEQAVGVLVERGLEPEAARRQLRRRAGEAGTTVGTAGRALLTSLRAGPGAG